MRHYILPVAVLLVLANPLAAQLNTIGVVRNSDKTIEIVCGSKEGPLYNALQTVSGDNWGGFVWTELGQAFFNNTFTGYCLGGETNGRIFCVAMNPPNYLDFTEQGPLATSVWDNWALVDHPFKLEGTGFGSIAAADSVNGDIVLFMLNSDKTVWRTSRNHLTGAWTPMTPFDGSQLMMITAARNSDGSMELFALGGDRKVWHIRQSGPTGPWGGWTSLDGNDLQAITTGIDKNGTLEVFALGGDHAIYHLQKNLQGNWGGWEPLGGTAIQEFTVVNDQDGRLEILALGGNAVVYDIYQTTANGSWGAWKTVGGQNVVQIAAALSATGRLTLFALEKDGSIHATGQLYAGSDWSGQWTTLPLPRLNGTDPFAMASPTVAPVVTKPKVTITHGTTYIPIKATVTFSWSVTNCNSCLVVLTAYAGLGYDSLFINNSVSTAGSYKGVPPETNTKYVITATGSNGKASANVQYMWQEAQ